MSYCHDAAVELDQRFDMNSVLRMQPFGSQEKVDALVQGHWVREQVTLAQSLT